MFISTEFVVEHFSLCYCDGLEDISGHVQDDEVTIGDMGARVECGVGSGLGDLGSCNGCHYACRPDFEGR